jgi:ribonuclease BN (tRNA processing enzyme)
MKLNRPASRSTKARQAAPPIRAPAEAAAVRATFLGTSDGHTSATRDHSGIVLETVDGNVLLDCGAAASRYLLGAKFNSQVPEIIWISHMHSDHIGQFSALIQSLWLRQRQEPLHVYGPGKVLRVLKDWLDHTLLFSELIGFPIRWHAVKPGVTYPQGAFEITPFATDHLASLAGHFKRSYPKTSFECYGCVLEHAGRRYVYSADLATPRELRPALERKKTTALFCELTHFPERELFHEAARHSIETLWITHYPDTLMGREEELRRLAQEEGFTGFVRLAHDKVVQSI